MPDRPPPLHGGCPCGAVRCEATPDPRDGCCHHCHMCQLAFGNSCAAFLNMRKSELRGLSAPLAYCASSRITRRGFCSRCGKPLGFEFLDGTMPLLFATKDFA